MKRFLTLVSLLVVVLLVAGCAPAPAEPAAETMEAQPPAAETGEELYIFLPKGLDNPYWDECRKGMEAKAAELGVKAEFLGPETSDAAKQVAIFESVVARKPAGISVSPNDPETVKAAVAAAMAAGIPVIAWDADVPGSERIAYVGTNNFEAGKFAGEELAKAIGGKGKVAILHGALTAANAIERVDGFLEALKNYPDIEVVATEPTEDNPATSLAKAEALLQAHPDLAAFYGVTGVGVPGASGAVKQAGVCGQVKVVGFDVVPQGIEAMRDGCADVLISQRPFGMTQIALQMLYDLHRGTQPESEFTDTGVVAVYPDTLEEFLTTSH